MNSSKKNLIKLLIITFVVGLVIVGGVIGYLTMKESADPTVIAQKVEQDKQNNGFYIKVAELTELMRQQSDTVAVNILERVCEEVQTTKIIKIEQGGVRGNYTFYIDNYVLDVLIRGTTLEEIRIGNSLIYKRIANTNDKSVSIQEKIYTFTEYNTIVEKFAKSMKVSKAVAAKNYSILTSLDILNFTDVKKVKSDTQGVTKYKGISMNIPLEITVTGETITKVEIVHKTVGRILVYDKNNETGEKQTIRNHIPIYGERTFLPESLAYQVAQVMGGKEISIRFPVAINTGDDSWLMIKKDGEIYMEVVGDVTKSGSTKSMKFVLIRGIESKELTYVKVDNKVYMGEK